MNFLKLTITTFALLLLLSPTLSASALSFTPQVPIPGMEKNFTTDAGGYKIDGNSIGNYIKTIYNYAIAIIGIVAAVAIMYGGVLWMTAGGNGSQVEEARGWITGSITGIILAMSSYMILNTINPALVGFKSIKIDPIVYKNTATGGESGYSKEIVPGKLWRFTVGGLGGSIHGPFNTEYDCETAASAYEDAQITVPCNQTTTEKAAGESCAYAGNGKCISASCTGTNDFCVLGTLGGLTGAGQCSSNNYSCSCTGNTVFASSNECLSNQCSDNEICL